MKSMAIGGVDSEFHRNVLIHLFRYFLCLVGIPWAMVMNFFLPIIIWIMCFWPSILGYTFSQVCRLLSISSIIFGQGSFPFCLFPIWAPRYLVVSPSLRI